MIKKNEFNKRPVGNSGQGGPSQGFAQRNQNEINQNREAGKNRENSPNRENTQSREVNPNRENTQARENRPPRENNPPRSYNKDNSNRENSPRPNYSNQNSTSRHYNRIRSEETIDDIKADIVRIEKEIDLELKEIKTMRLGM